MAEAKQSTTTNECKASFEESFLLKSLRYCKGITSNSMISMVLPSYSEIDSVISRLKELSKKTTKDYEELMLYGDPNDDNLINDAGITDYKYAIKAYDETADFLSKIVFIEEDKKAMGLIIYYGYIDDGTTSSTLKDCAKKVFHTFPCPKDFKDCPDDIKYEIKLAQRFDLNILNFNSWFTDEFNYIS